MATAYYLQTAIGWEEMPEDVVAKIEAGRNAGSTIVPVHAFGDSMEIRFGADAKLGPAMQAKTGIVQKNTRTGQISLVKRYPPLPSVGVPRTSGTSVKSPAGANAGRGSHMSMRGGPPSGTPPRRTSAASVSQGGETGACGGGAAFQHRSNPNAPWEPFAIEHNATIAAAIANGSGSGRVTLAGINFQIRFGDEAKSTNLPNISPTRIIQVNMANGNTRVVRRCTSFSKQEINGEWSAFSANESSLIASHAAEGTERFTLPKGPADRPQFKGYEIRLGERAFSSRLPTVPKTKMIRVNLSTGETTVVRQDPPGPEFAGVDPAGTAAAAAVQIGAPAPKSASVPPTSSASWGVDPSVAGHPPRAASTTMQGAGDDGSDDALPPPPADPNAPREKLGKGKGIGRNRNKSTSSAAASSSSSKHHGASIRQTVGSFFKRSSTKGKGSSDSKLITLLNEVEDVVDSWGEVVAAAKATHLGSTLLDSNISKENVERYAIEMSVKLSEAYKARMEEGKIRPSQAAVCIVVTSDSVGALKGHYKRGMVDPTTYELVGKDECHDVFKVLTINPPAEDDGTVVTSYDKSPQPQFFAYVVRSPVGGFQQLHVFSLLHGKERDMLRDQLTAVTPAATVMDKMMLDAQQEFGEVVIAGYLGCSLVSADTFWEHKALKGMPFTEGDEKPLDELFDAAIAVRIAEDGQADAEDSMLLEDGGGSQADDFVVVPTIKEEKGLEDTAGVLFANDKPISVIKVLSQDKVATIVPAMIIDARVFDRPGAAAKDGGDGVLDGRAKLDVQASMRQLTNAQLIDVQMKVASGNMTIDEALAAALEQDQLGHNEELMEQKMVCVCIKDPELNTVKIEVFEIPSGAVAKRLADRLNAAGIKAMESQDDPFRPKSNVVEPRMAGVIGEAELDRDRIHAVKMVGQGEFGEVFLATHAIPVDEVPKGDPIRTAGTEILRGEYQIQVAVKTVKPSTGPNGIKEFTAEAAVQLELKHDNIASLVGVCMVQKPYLAILEYIMYGDLKKVLETFKGKKQDIKHVEQLYLAKQLAAGLDFIAKKEIVHLDIAARNCLLHSKTQLKIADFGLSRRYTKPDGYHMAGKMKIPFLWCPPECLPRHVWNKKFKFRPVFNQQSDIWAYGVVCWEIASYGKAPYGAKTKLIQVLQKIDEGLRLTYPVTCAPALKAMAERCHALRKEDRPLFAEIDKELAAVLAAPVADDSSGAPLMDMCRDLGKVLNGNLDALVKEQARQSAVSRGESLGLLRAKHLDDAAAASPPGSPATRARRGPRPSRPNRPTQPAAAAAAGSAAGANVVKRRPKKAGSRKSGPSLSANRRLSINLSAVDDGSLHVPASFAHLSLSKSGTIERKKVQPMEATEEGDGGASAAAASAAAYKAAQDAKFNRPDSDIPALQRKLSGMNFSSFNRAETGDGVADEDNPFAAAAGVDRSDIDDANADENPFKYATAEPDSGAGGADTPTGEDGASSASLDLSWSKIPDAAAPAVAAAASPTPKPAPRRPGSIKKADAAANEAAEAAAAATREPAVPAQTASASHAADKNAAKKAKLAALKARLKALEEKKAAEAAKDLADEHVIVEHTADIGGSPPPPSDSLDGHRLSRNDDV